MKNSTPYGTIREPHDRKFLLYSMQKNNNTYNYNNLIQGGLIKLVYY